MDEQQELARLRALNVALVQLGLLSVRERSLQALLDHATRIVREATGTDASKILERRRGGSLVVRAGDGWPPGVVGELEIPEDGDSQASYALRTRSPVVVPDLGQETRFTAHPAFLRLGVRSGVNVIIDQEPDPFGVLEVDSFRPHEYSPDDIAFLQSTANLLSVAIARQQHEEERDHLIDLTAHELRNPLTVVMGRSQRLLGQVAHGTSTADEVHRDLALVHTEAARLHRLLNMFLELGRVERTVLPRETLTPIAALVLTQVQQTLESYPEVAFDEELPESEVAIPADYDLARLVIGNVIENAAKYSRLEPRVIISLRTTTAGAVLRVRDRCGGIAGEDLDRLFDRFFRGNSANLFRGFGLGLFIAHRAAERLRWRIDVQNYPGDGCEFVITMPGATAAAVNQGR